MDAFYQCHRNKDLVKAVLDNYFKHSSGHVWLVSDAGDGFSKVAASFPGRVTYRYSTVNTGFCFKKKDDTSELSAMERAIEWLNRVADCCLNSTSEWIILLEDDVLIRGDIDGIVPPFKIAGPPVDVPEWGNSIPLPMAVFISSHSRRCCTGPAHWRTYGGCGGSIFHRETFIYSFDYAVWKIKEYWHDLVVASARPLNKTNPNSAIYWMDFVLTLVFNLSGHEYGGNPDHTEPWIHKDWETNGKRIVHQYEFKV